LDVQDDVDLVRQDDLGAVGGQAEGDAEVAAADRSPGGKADPCFSLQPGRVTSRIVSSPDISHVPSAGRSPALAKDITGYRSAAKKSADRRWLSRISLPVLTDETAMAAA